MRLATSAKVPTSGNRHSGMPDDLPQPHCAASQYDDRSEIDASRALAASVGKGRSSIPATIDGEHDENKVGGFWADILPIF